MPFSKMKNCALEKSFSIEPSHILAFRTYYSFLSLLMIILIRFSVIVSFLLDIPSGGFGAEWIVSLAYMCAHIRRMEKANPGKLWTNKYAVVCFAYFNCNCNLHNSKQFLYIRISRWCIEYFSPCFTRDYSIWTLLLVVSKNTSAHHSISNIHIPISFERKCDMPLIR